MMDPPGNKNHPFSNKQEKDDYWFHEYIVSLLSVEEPVSIDELLGKQETGVGYVQENGGTKPELPSYTSSLHEKNAASNENALLPSDYTSDSQRCVLPRNYSYVIALPALNRSSATKIESSSSTSSLLLSANEGNCLSQVPESTERYLEPSEIEARATKDFTLSSVHIARSSATKIESPSSTSSLLLSASQGHRLSLNPASSERHLRPSENQFQATKDFTQSSVHNAGEDFSQSLSKRKRKVHSSDRTEERGSCRNCNCMMSNCLKPNCECFAAGVYCTEPCSCKECLNKPIDEYITILQTQRKIESSNSHLLVPKVIRSPDTSPRDNSNKTPASKNCKTMCNCKKTSCNKKSCSCSKGGVGCSISCKCEGCENIYGRKDNQDQELRRESNAIGSQTKFEKHFQTVPDDGIQVTFHNTNYKI
ncbi:hypothetical protein P8452_10396 [Trifolium repens]|nr:hypothetical protein P8452_10396 [Trifolium repens]